LKALEVISDIIINAAIAHGFVISLFFQKHLNRKSLQLFPLLLMSLSLIVFRSHYLMEFSHEKLGNSYFIAGPFVFLLAPLLFFYLRGIVIPDSSLKKNDIKHFIFFVLYILLAIPFFLYGRDSTYSAIVQKSMGSPWIFLILQFGYYLVKSHRLIKLHKKNIVEKYSNVESMDVNWLNLIIWIFVATLIFIAIGTPTLIHGVNFHTYHVTSSIYFSLVLFFIAYKGIQQRVPQESLVIIDNGTELSDVEEIKRLTEKLHSHMKEARPYLDPELSLSDLAKQLHIGRNQLSQVINSGVGDNFYNFINKFRIEEVKLLIKNDRDKKHTLRALANDAGFNSKSSFNNIFKKITGLTPSEYRDGHN
jgi:AraC-like DNA-binding protein